MIWNPREADRIGVSRMVIGSAATPIRNLLLKLLMSSVTELS